MQEIGLLEPTELTHWCVEDSAGDPQMGRTWLQVMQMTNDDAIEDDLEDSDDPSRVDPRLDVAHNYIAAVLGVLGCACDCPELNTVAVAECEALKFNISVITRLFFDHPHRRCPSRTAITAEVLAISAGMSEWLRGLRGVPECTGTDLICHENPLVTNAFDLVHGGEAHLNGVRPIV